MKISRIPLGIYAANCYILTDEDTKDTAIIDPGGNAEFLINEIEKLNVNVKYILLTHGHADHIGGVNEVKKHYNIPAYINSKDMEMISSGEDIFGKLWDNTENDKVIKEGDVLSLGNLKIKCIETPGHTPGGMCFLVENVIFTGDTLFQGSIGRTDFIGGDFDSLITNVRTKLMCLNDDIMVLPGHGPESSIGYEKKNNPFL